MNTPMPIDSTPPYSIFLNAGGQANPYNVSFNPALFPQARPGAQYELDVCTQLSEDPTACVNSLRRGTIGEPDFPGVLELPMRLASRKTGQELESTARRAIRGGPYAEGFRRPTTQRVKVMPYAPRPNPYGWTAPYLEESDYALPRSVAASSREGYAKPRRGPNARRVPLVHPGDFAVRQLPRAIPGDYALPASVPLSSREGYRPPRVMPRPETPHNIMLERTMMV